MGDTGSKLGGRRGWVFQAEAKSAGKEVKKCGPFRKVSEVYVPACESTFGEVVLDEAGERKHNWIYNLV